MLKLKLYFITFLFVFLPLPAYAYIDPGTGSMILQVLVAGLVACMVFIQGIRVKIVALFRKITGKKDCPDQVDKE